MGKSKPFKEGKQQGCDKDQQPKIELLEVTADSDIRELMFRFVEILRKQGITVTPAEKNSLLKHDA